MSEVTLGSCDCLLFNILQTSVCGGLKPFQTGTPFCGLHLRDVFGLQATYFGPKKLDNDHVMTFGPFLQVAPDKKFEVGTCIFPRKATLQKALDAQNDREPVNPYLMSFYEMLKTKKEKKSELMSVHDLLLNWMENDLEMDTGRETDKCVRDRKMRFSNVYKEEKTFVEAAKCVHFREGDAGQETLLSSQPFMLAFCGLHIATAIYSYSKDYVTQTAVSNVSLSDKGYFCLKTLEHLDVLIQMGRLSNPAYHNLILQHQRLKTIQDVNAMSLEYNTLVGNCAYKSPFKTFGFIRSGESTCPYGGK